MQRVCTGVLSTVAGAWISARAAELRFIYLTPSDRVCWNEYEAGIEKAAQGLQTWFASVEGATSVQTVRSPDPQGRVMVAAPVVRGGKVDLSFSGGAIGALYLVEATDSLMPPDWRTVAEGASDLAGGMEVRGLAAEGARRFYRLRRK